MRTSLKRPDLTEEEAENCSF